MQPISLTPTLLQSFEVTKSFDTNQASLSSLSFDDTGDLCVTSAQDDSINIYDCKEGKLVTTLFSKKYGVGLTRFTHQSSGIVYGSTKEDGTLRYLSIHDNKYIRYFNGHKDRIVSLEMSPLDDKLISASLDGSIRLWDLRTPYCEGMINSNGRPIAAIDNAGLIFGIGLDSEVLRLYDIRSFDTGPFATWTIPEPELRKGTYHWTSLKFTNDGQHIVLGTSTGIHYVLDAFEGHLLKRLVGGSMDTPLSLNGIDINLDDSSNNNTYNQQQQQQQQQQQCGEELTISPDARYVFGGGIKDGVVRVWDLLDGNNKNNNNDDDNMNGNQPFLSPSTTIDFPNAELTSRDPDQQPTTHDGINVLGFNPSLMMMVSGGNKLDFWQPTDLDF